MRRLLIAASATLAFSGPAFAQMYKCTENGKVTYRERPCDGGIQDRIKIQEPSATPSAAQERPGRGTVRRNPRATTGSAHSAAPQGTVADSK